MQRARPTERHAVPVPSTEPAFQPSAEAARGFARATMGAGAGLLGAIADIVHEVVETVDYRVDPAFLEGVDSLA